MLKKKSLTRLGASVPTTYMPFGPSIIVIMGSMGDIGFWNGFQCYKFEHMYVVCHTSELLAGCFINFVCFLGCCQTWKGHKTPGQWMAPNNYKLIAICAGEVLRPGDPMICGYMSQDPSSPSTSLPGAGIVVCWELEPVSWCCVGCHWGGDILLLQPKKMK